MCVRIHFASMNLTESGFFVWVGSFFCVCMRWVAVAVVVWVGWWAFVVSHAIIARAGHTKKRPISFSLSPPTDSSYSLSDQTEKGSRPPA